LSPETAYDPFADARKAASLILLRDTAGGGIEVLMLRRAERDGDLRSGAAVFPGGVLDARDRDAHEYCRGWDDARASAALGLEQGGLDYLIAAARECFEEVGLLLAGPTTAEVLTAAHADWRGPMQRGERSAAECCRTLGLTFDFSAWAYYSHWLTPPGVPKRFDTRFFVTLAPPAQQAVADEGEAVEVMWLTPAQALDPQRALKLLPVTRRTLQQLARFDRAEAAVAWAAAQPRVPLTMPRRALSAKGMQIVLPDEHAWAEIGRIDPSGRCDAHCDIVAGRAVRLSPRIVRVTAPNPGVMTGPGTNTYLVGDPAVNRWTVIDPGPADAQHLAAIQAAAPGPIERIVVTHTHIDHSLGARALAEATGAPVLGRRPRFAGGQDAGFAPTAEMSGDTDEPPLQLGPAATLKAIHTPGHASNHLCWLLVEEKLLFTGDHVMQGSTVVINPPDGDMAAYLVALRGLLALEIDWLAPGHGFLVAQPKTVIEALIRHRLGREAKVLGALSAAEWRELGALVASAYADTPAALHPVARRSLLAHLIKLRDEGLAESDPAKGEAARWRAAV
jgi:glyoxylase-like metal-dependent hydrolase (beta-lactamase superfamily II)/8-oxo-dGTP pyrophosphatase MutT (NUDIX family)